MLYNQLILFNSFKEKSNFDFFKDIIELDCYSIVKSEKDLLVLNSPEFIDWLKLKNFLIFGTGGSSLGGQAIFSALKKSDKKVTFVSNLDPTSLISTLSKTDFENTGFLFISKSGETLETITQLLLVMDTIKNSSNFKNRFLIITENKESTLHEISHQNNFMCFEHPKTIGGRYSVFSLVGMVPAMICGLDPRSIRAGGKRVLDNFSNSIYKTQEGANFVFQNYRGGKSNHVSFIYSDKLAVFGAWLAQLYAESSGKDGKGITPLTALGSIDQHSQLQLYLDGTKDKCFTFFYERQDKSIALSDIDIPEKFSYLKNQKISTIFESQCKATIKTLLKNGANVRQIELPSLDSLTLGALFMHFMIEVSCVCKLMDVNPFDQPAVEQGKIFTKNLLSENPC